MILQFIIHFFIYIIVILYVVYFDFPFYKIIISLNFLYNFLCKKVNLINCFSKSYFNIDLYSIFINGILIKIIMIFKYLISNHRKFQVYRD